MTGTRAVIICEHDFLDVHVGVRRVTAHHVRRLQRAGFTVDFAAPWEGVLRLACASRREQMLAMLDDARSGADTPFDWRELAEAPAAKPGQDRRTPSWDGAECDPDDYDVSLLTAPWIAASPDFPDVRLTHCVVHDLVPNLISAQVLDVGECVDAVAFGHEHHVGYLYVMRRVGTALCVSASTQRDLRDFYGQTGPADIVVDTPFDLPDGAADGVPDRPAPGGGRPVHVLLVNALDPRKNIDAMRTAIVRLAPDLDMRVTVVGRERMPWSNATALLSAMAEATEVTWYRECSDALLERLYREADVLLFPSVYEGLGLPILEAQAVGLPAITTDTSSCREINLNVDLQCPSTSAEDIATVVEDFARGRRQALRAADLVRAQVDFLRGRRSAVGW